MKQVQSLVELILFFENIIFDNERDFIQQFCIMPEHVLDLLSVYFCADRVRFYYNDREFVTKTDEISYSEFELWAKFKVPQ
jgi:hypothetical protein